MSRFISLRTLLESWAMLTLLVLIALTPVSSKAVNLAWIVVIFFVAWLFASRFRLGVVARDFGGLRPALYILGGFFAAGFLFKLGMMLYWSEPVRGVAFELTATVSAGAALVIASRWQGGYLHLALLAGALAIASGLALLQGCGYTFSGHAGPTNPVNWGAGIALFMCVALAINVHDQARARDKILAVVGLCLFSLAIFVAGRRGAFFAILWVAMGGCYIWLRTVRQRVHWTIQWWVPVLAVFGVMAIASVAKEQLATPVNRVANTIEEISLRWGRDLGSDEVPRGTLGGRIHMLELGLTAGSASPWVGLGVDERSSLIKRAELHLQEPLFHLHNEYLQAWVAHGVPGLVGALCYPVGLIVAGFTMRRRARSPSLALTGMGLVHLVSGLTNVNTFHNYYGTVFAVCVVTPFFMLRSVSQAGDSAQV